MALAQALVMAAEDPVLAFASARSFTIERPVMGHSVPSRIPATPRHRTRIHANRRRQGFAGRNRISLIYAPRPRVVGETAGTEGRPTGLAVPGQSFGCSVLSRYQSFGGVGCTGLNCITTAELARMCSTLLLRLQSRRSTFFHGDVFSSHNTFRALGSGSLDAVTAIVRLEQETIPAARAR